MAQRLSEYLVHSTAASHEIAGRGTFAVTVEDPARRGMLSRQQAIITGHRAIFQVILLETDDPTRLDAAPDGHLRRRQADIPPTVAPHRRRSAAPTATSPGSQWSSSAANASDQLIFYTSDQATLRRRRHRRVAAARTSHGKSQPLSNKRGTREIGRDKSGPFLRRRAGRRISSGGHRTD